MPSTVLLRIHHSAEDIMGDARDSDIRDDAPLTASKHHDAVDEATAALVEDRGEALIGRPDATRGIHPEIDLRMDDAVSRRHAKIFVKNGVYVLTDLNSTNGTRYNREWVQPEKEFVLKAGDEIEVGELTLIRVIEAPNPNA